MKDIAPRWLPSAPADTQVCSRHAMLDLAQTQFDAFMKGADWNAPGKLKPAA